MNGDQLPTNQLHGINWGAAYYCVCVCVCVCARVRVCVCVSHWLEWALAVAEISQAAKREEEIEKITKEQQKKVIVQKRYEEWLASKVALEKERKSKQQKEMTEKAAQENEVHIRNSQIINFTFQKLHVPGYMHNTITCMYQECSTTNAHVTSSSCIFSSKLG